MAQNEHTPGPWSYDDEGDQIVEEARPHMRIAFLPSDHAECANSRPNGRLIAAAPDLLEVLRRADHTLTVHGHIDGGTPLHETIRTAIAAAIRRSHDAL